MPPTEVSCPEPVDGTPKGTPLISNEVIVSMFWALEKLVDIDALAVPFRGIVKVKISSNEVLAENESKNMEEIKESSGA
jgi:hypothetical protein